MYIFGFLGIVFVGTVASTIVGMIWYSNFIFGRAWQKFSGIVPTKASQMKMLVLGFIADYIISLGLLFTSAYTGLRPMMVALCIWIAFFVPIMSESFIYENRSWKLLAIKTGHRLLALFATALVFMVM